MTVPRRASPNSLCAASALRLGSIWKQTASLLTEVHSQARLDRSSPRSSWTRQPVSSAWRSAALFWCARIAWARARTAARSASDYRPASRARPSGPGWRTTRQRARGARGGSRHSARTKSAPRSWSRRAFWGTAAAPGRRHFHGRRRALAGPAPARTADHALVGLDLDLDEGGFLGAVRRIGLPAPSADAHIGRRVVLFGALIEAGPLGAAVAGRAVLLAAWAPGARLLLLLALAAVERPRQHGPGCCSAWNIDPLLGVIGVQN